MKSQYHFSDYNDQQLINLFIAGDSTAFAYIVYRYKSKIFTSIYLLVKDKALAEDIFQDVFIRIIETLKTGPYTDKGKFLPWALRIAHNICIDHFRKVKHMPMIKASVGFDLFESKNFTPPEPEIKFRLTDSHLSLNKLVDKLPEEQREVIMLRHFADLSFREIAEITNSSLNTALGRMRYGLINLRKMLPESQCAFN